MLALRGCETLTRCTLSRAGIGAKEMPFANMRYLTISDAKQRLQIPALWRHFGFVGEPKTSCRCPWREDQKPSFSVSPDGQVWNDFATGEAGDVVDFFQRASGLPRKEACRKFIQLAGGGTFPAISQATHPATAEPRRGKPTFPAFERGTAAELRALATVRGIGQEGLEWASERGLLWFAALKDCRAWIVTDSARLNAQARRLDGQVWDHLGGRPKAWTLPGSWASWPIGAKEAQPFETIALCEGGPDLLAAHYLALWEQAPHYATREVRCAPVAMLGASLKIHPDALTLFRGKQIRVFPHADRAGRAAAVRWAAQLQSVGADVNAFDFEGLCRANGEPVKDLNDALAIDLTGLSETERMLP